MRLKADRVQLAEEFSARSPVADQQPSQIRRNRRVDAKCAGNHLGEAWHRFRIESFTVTGARHVCQHRLENTRHMVIDRFAQTVLGPVMTEYQGRGHGRGRRDIAHRHRFGTPPGKEAQRFVPNSGT